MNPPHHDHRSHATRRIVIAACLGLVTGLAFRGLFPAASASKPHAVAAATVGRVGPSRTVAGVPAGFAHSAAGARAAATSDVLTGQILVNLSPSEAELAVAAMAAAASRVQQVDDLARRLTALRGRLAAGHGPVRYWQAVLATGVDAYSPGRARVAVWSVGVLSRTGVATPQSAWTTSTFDLVWERADWKIWSETVTVGPTPILNEAGPPSTADRFDAALDGFDPWRAS